MGGGLGNHGAGCASKEGRIWWSEDVGEESAMDGLAGLVQKGAARGDGEGDGFGNADAAAGPGAMGGDEYIVLRQVAKGGKCFLFSVPFSQRHVAVTL